MEIAATSAQIEIKAIPRRRGDTDREPFLMATMAVNASTVMLC